MKQYLAHCCRPSFKFIFDNKPLLIAAMAAVGIAAIVLALGPGSLAVAAIVGSSQSLGS